MELSALKTIESQIIGLNQANRRMLGLLKQIEVHANDRLKSELLELNYFMSNLLTLSENLLVDFSTQMKNLEQNVLFLLNKCDLNIESFKQAYS